MKVLSEDFSHTEFKEVKIGEIFRYHNCIYLKVGCSKKPMYDEKKNPINAICLSDCTPADFAESINVLCFSGEIMIRK